ncbi:MAG: substrate-binding domain-containing protein [Anaerolineae bacterium]|nr:substrate-binding domain-containing protein [Anaerolineae bacterium]
MAILIVSGCSTLADPQVTTTSISLATDGSTQQLGERLLNAYETERPDAVLALIPSSRSTAIEAVKSGEVDAALLFHPSTDPELYQVVIGYEYLVFITHPSSELIDIDRQTARAIFGDQPVQNETVQYLPVVREGNSSAQIAFEELILRGSGISSTAQIATSDSNELHVVGNTPGAIGYIPHHALNEDVKVLAYKGVSPTLENVSTNHYPLTTSVVFVCQSEPEDDLASLLDWILSRDGQNVVKLMMPGTSDN